MPTLDWVGKDEALKKDKSIPYKFLQEDTNLSYIADSTENNGENPGESSTSGKVSRLKIGDNPDRHNIADDSPERTQRDWRFEELQGRNDNTDSTHSTDVDYDSRSSTANPTVGKTDAHSSSGDPKNTGDNMIIQADNLEALKALLPHYRGKVKCIYRPPLQHRQCLCAL